MDNQLEGGIIDIPDGWFIDTVNFDDDEPYITIMDDHYQDNDPIKLLVPKSLAYYLSTHYCGSEKMRKIYINQGKEEIRNSIKRTLNI